jgi:hypothetical protein
MAANVRAPFESDGIFKLMSRWDKFNNRLEDCVEKQRYFNGINELHKTLKEEPG